MILAILRGFFTSQYKFYIDLPISTEEHVGFNKFHRSGLKTCQKLLVVNTLMKEATPSGRNTKTFYWPVFH
jgi:hypothetical protein